MCTHCYEKFVKRTGKTMLLCKLRASESTNNGCQDLPATLMLNETRQLCCFQHFCPDKDRYVADERQDTECKFYK